MSTKKYKNCRSNILNIKKPNTMVKKLIEDNFKIICNQLLVKWNKTDNISEMEELFLALLHFIKNNDEAKECFMQHFIARINGEGDWPLEAIAFCMRELQYEEIKQAAIQRKLNTNDWRIISAMERILAVYKINWEDEEYYQYYFNAGAHKE